MMSSLLGTVSLPTDQAYLYYALILIVLVLILLFIAYYTLKRVIINFVLGYGTLFGIQYFFGPQSVDDGTLMMALIALFGPLPVVLDALWHYFM